MSQDKPSLEVKFGHLGWKLPLTAMLRNVLPVLLMATSWSSSALVQRRVPPVRVWAGGGSGGCGGMCWTAVEGLAMGSKAGAA